MPSHTEFIPPRLRIHEWEDIEPYFTELQRRRPRSRDGLIELIHQYSDVLSVYQQNDVEKKLNYARDTTNTRARILLDTSTTNIAPTATEHIATIERHIVDHRTFRELRNDSRYGHLATMLQQGIEKDPSICIPIHTEIALIQKRCEELLSTIQIGELSTTDRERRQETWRAYQQEQQRIRHQIDAYFTALVELRHKLSRQAGYKNYRQYVHYGPYIRHQDRSATHHITDVARFHRAIEQHVVPLANTITHRHRERLGLQGKLLRPWDTDASSHYGFQAPIIGEERTIATNTEEFVTHTTDTLTVLHPAFGKAFSFLEKRGLMDLESREGKLTDAYCESMEARRLPFIFMNGTKELEDLSLATHEFGHAFHVLETREEPLIFYRFYGLDYTMAETASEMMDILCSTHWNLPTPEMAHIARRNYLEELVRFFPWTVIVDKFQQWLYEHPHCAPTERDGYFVHLMQRLYPEEINWRGLENDRKKYWQQSGHILTSPFYYIQYAFAQLAAIEGYRNYLENPATTLQQYRQGLQLGASKPYPVVWQEMGLTLDFSPKGFDKSLRKIPELMGFVMQEIEKLDQEIERAI